MYILHVTKKLPPIVGGDATAVSSLARVQTRRGFVVDILTYRAPGVEETERVHPVGPQQSPQQLDRIGLRRIRAMTAMRRWADEHLGELQPDVIHAHAVDVGLPVSRAARPRGIPVILTCHGVWFSGRSRIHPLGWLERSLIRGGRYAAITSVDRVSVDALRRAGFSSVELIPNGVDMEEFEGAGPTNGPFRFLFVGRHVHQKGLDVLVKAVALLRKEGGPAFGVEIAGDGPVTDKIRKMSEQLHVGDAIHFLGPLSRDRLREAYRRADAFVLPSRYEGLPIALLEAWSAALPVIATSVGGIPDLAGHGNAILVPPEDPDALCQAMARILNDPSMREQMGRTGRDLVRRDYTWDAIADRYEALYRRCMSRPAEARR